MTMPQGTNSGAADFAAATAWRASQIQEYSQWEAAQPIYHGNALAYNEGDPVPASNVIAWNYDANGLVRRPDGWSDPVPGDDIEDEPAAASGIEAAPAGVSTVDSDVSTVDDASAGEPSATAVKRTGKR